MSIQRSRSTPKRNGVARSCINSRAGFRPQNGCEKPVLITGGAGFIGTNLADRLCNSGKKVLLYDNLSRPGVEQNLAWLRETHGKQVELLKSDTRDFKTLHRAVSRASQVFHFAAQVAVTTSLDDPIEDFEINARGTLNLLEAIRAQAVPPPVIFTSTNKVYGDLQEVKLTRSTRRYEPVDAALRTNGFGEDCPLHFHSPYGCSKGAACQYVLDYARTFGLRTAVFRMSCIYGPHQFGTEDQGWVAHFLIKAIEEDTITIYGDGRQVRDILFVDDLMNAFLAAQTNIEKISGQAFNIGGGPDRTISLLELLNLIGELHGHKPHVQFSEWRAADQQYYVSDTRKFSLATGWRPQVHVREGIGKLYEWLLEYRTGTRSRPVRTTAPAGQIGNGKSHKRIRARNNGMVAVGNGADESAVERKLAKAF